MALQGMLRSFKVLRQAEHHTFGCSQNCVLFRVVPRWRATSSESVTARAATSHTQNENALYFPHVSQCVNATTIYKETQVGDGRRQRKEGINFVTNGTTTCTQHGLPVDAQPQSDIRHMAFC
eukprot:2353955-Pleurochrysis_carterae.AAC.1